MITTLPETNWASILIFATGGALALAVALSPRAARAFSNTLAYWSHLVRAHGDSMTRAYAAYQVAWRANMAARIEAVADEQSVQPTRF
jgi:hypothetical protein